MLNLSDVGTIPTRTPKMDALEKLLRVFTAEQLLQYAEMCSITQENAKLRQCEQSLTIVFNTRGLPRHFNATNNVDVVKPTG